MLEPFFQWMNDLAVSKAIGESIWIYPLVQAIHLLFLALFAGALLIVDLRLMGFGMREQPVAIRARSGGERLQPDRRRPRRTLKNLMQEARIPPWERERLPLVFCGGDLAWVPALGIDCAYQAAPGERSVSPSWRSGADPGRPAPMTSGSGRSPGRKRAPQVP